VVLPLFILGFSKASFGGVLVVFSLQALFIHANVRFTFGPLRRLIVTPEFHHWHHGIEPAADNTNFVWEFPWIDAVFGTLHLPKKRGRPVAASMCPPPIAGCLSWRCRSRG